MALLLLLLLLLLLRDAGRGRRADDRGHGVGREDARREGVDGLDRFVPGRAVEGAERGFVVCVCVCVCVDTVYGLV
jgi:hypothetical protein